MLHKKEGKNINRLIRDLYFKRKVYQEFRENPEKVGLQYVVSKEAIEAIKKDDWKELINRGMDPRLLDGPAYRIIDKVRLWFARLVVSALILVSGVLINVENVRAGTPRPKGPRFERVRSLRKASTRLVERAKNKRFLVNRLKRVIGNFYEISRRLADRKARVLTRLTRKARSLRAREIARILSRKAGIRVDRVRAFKIEIEGITSEAPIFDDCPSSSPVYSDSIKILDPIE